MAWTETNFTVKCERTGTEHAISVALPLRYDRLETAPLVLCMDGAWTFGAVRDATRIMSMSGEAPEAVVVGVSFNDDSMAGYLRSRASWYTPTPWVPPEETGVKGIAAEDCGRALDHLAFLRDQLLPRLVADYRFGERWLVGHSFSGLFGLQALFAEPDLFDKYLLASPSIWWHERSILDVEAKYAEANDDLPAEVFLSVGDQEDVVFGDSYHMRANIEELAATLAGRGYANLEVSYALLSAENHNSSIGAAMSRGLRALMLPSS